MANESQPAITLRSVKEWLELNPGVQPGQLFDDTAIEAHPTVRTKLDEVGGKLTKSEAKVVGLGAQIARTGAQSAMQAKIKDWTPEAQFFATTAFEGWADASDNPAKLAEWVGTAAERYKAGTGQEAVKPVQPAGDGAAGTGDGTGDGTGAGAGDGNAGAAGAGAAGAAGAGTGAAAGAGTGAGAGGTGAAGQPNQPPAGAAPDPVETSLSEAARHHIRRRPHSMAWHSPDSTYQSPSRTPHRAPRVSPGVPELVGTTVCFPVGRCEAAHELATHDLQVRAGHGRQGRRRPTEA